MIFFKKTSRPKIPSKVSTGFTIVELMVALGIYILMTTLLIANQGNFNNSLQFSNLGYDIALTIRQAQTYGYAVRNVTPTSETSDFSSAYGIHFTKDSPTSFTIFSEAIANESLPTVSGPGPYVDMVNTPTVSVYNLQNGYSISALCYGANNTCAGALDASCNADSLDIVFQRPNVNAFIFEGQQAVLDEGAIELTSPTGEKECISVFPSGDIEVSTTTAL